MLSLPANIFTRDVPATSVSSAARSPNSIPRELIRCGSRSRGSGILECRACAGAADDIGRPPRQRLERYSIVGGEGDKGRIGAVFQQPPDQVGQQVAVAADRRIGAVGELRMIFAQARVERFAHAVQPLEFDMPLSPPANSSTVATVSALWVANCGKMRGRSASSRCAQAT